MKNALAISHACQITELRQEVDEIDDEIMSLLARRLALTDRIGGMKQSQGIGIHDRGRERQIVDRIKIALKTSEPRFNSAIVSIFEEVFNQSRRLQSENAAAFNVIQQSSFPEVAVIGLGLIGGALARQIRERFPSTRIRACDNGGFPAQAVNEGVVDAFFDNPRDCVADASLIILAATPSANLEILRQLAPDLRHGQLIIDVTSTKSEVCREAEQLNLSADFIGGHPLFGSEKSGFSNSSEVKVEGKTFLVTPTKHSSETSLKRLSNWLGGLGLNVLSTEAGRHDACLAITSHLVQLLSVALGNVLVKENNDRCSLSIQEKVLLSGPSFQNLGRLMASPCRLWREILRSNKEHVLSAIESMQHELSIMQEALVSGDDKALVEQFSTASIVQSALMNRPD